MIIKPLALPETTPEQTMAGVAPDGVVIASVPPVMLVIVALVPEMFAPERVLVNVPEIPVMLLNCPVLPVMVAPDKCVVKVPLIPVALLNLAVSPVTVVPEI